MNIARRIKEFFAWHFHWKNQAAIDPQSDTIRIYQGPVYVERDLPSNWKPVHGTVRT